MTQALGRYRSLSLAGIVQTATMVHDTASGRFVTEHDRDVLFSAALTHNAQDLGEIFPQPVEYAAGVRRTLELLNGHISSPEVLRRNLPAS